MHKHNHCHHNLKHCEICDVVYCTNCSKEWGRTKLYPYYTYYPNVTWGEITVSSSTSPESHVHE